MIEFEAILYRTKERIDRVEPATQIVAVSKWVRGDARTSADLTRRLVQAGVPQQHASKTAGILIRRLTNQGALRMEQGSASWVWVFNRKPWE